MFTALARRGYERREKVEKEVEEAHDAQPRLVMAELRRAAFFEESHVPCASWLPTSDFILRAQISVIEPRVNNKTQMDYTLKSSLPH